MAVFSMASSLVVLLIGLFILHALPNCGSTPGVSTEIIHPESPLYDPTSTPSSRSGAAVHRSAALANCFRNANSNNSRLLAAPDINSIYLDGMGHRGQLLLKLVLGTPIQIALVIVSTTGPFSWVMCRPCETCGKFTAELFNPSASHTYETVKCESNSCESIRRVPCTDDRANCTYEQHYVEDLTASGILSRETLHFHIGSTDEFIVPDVLFGCTHQINGEKPEYEIFPTGFIGLNDDKLSIINQLFYINQIPRKFSFCIPLQNKFSRIYFGNTPPTDSDITTARLFIGQYDNLYYVHLKNIRVFFHGFDDTSPLQIAVEQENAPHSRIDGNIIIDSATHITFIHDNEMKELSKDILDGIQRKRVPVPEVLRPVIDLCFDWRKPNVMSLPVISFYLSDNALIYGREAFVDLGNGVLCLFIASTKHSDGVQNFGSSVLHGHRFEIDLQEKVVNIEAGHFGDCRDR